MKQMKFHQEMTAKQYERLAAPFSAPAGRTLLKWANFICAGVFYLAYPICIVILLLQNDSRLIKIMLVPAVSFVLLSIFRKLLNRPRPYETLDIHPLLKRESFGASFPSRHVFSAFMIAATISILTPWGFLMFVPAALLGIIRVIGGIHYPSDVIVGAIVALLFALTYLI